MNSAMKATTMEPTVIVMTSSMRVKPRATWGGARMSVARAVAGNGYAAARRVAHRDVDAAGGGRRHAGERARLRGDDAHRVGAQRRDRIAELIVCADVHQAVVLVHQIPAAASGIGRRAVGVADPALHDLIEIGAGNGDGLLLHHGIRAPARGRAEGTQDGGGRDRDDGDGHHHLDQSHTAMPCAHGYCTCTRPVAAMMVMVCVPTVMVPPGLKLNLP